MGLELIGITLSASLGGLLFRRRLARLAGLRRVLRCRRHETSRKGIEQRIAEVSGTSKRLEILLSDK